MEEFRHPPVEIDLTQSITPERAFAQRAFSLLETYSSIGQDEVFGQKVRFPITDRIDMAVPEGAPAEIAMRLVGTPVYQMPSHESVVTELVASEDTSEYIVMELQYGELPENDIEDAAEDEDFDWQSYIAIVINSKQPYNPSVLNANTGRPLSPADLMMASVILDQVCGEFEALTLDSAVSALTLGPTETIEKDKFGYKNFDPDEFIVSGSCAACSYEDIPCCHVPGSRN